MTFTINEAKFRDYCEFSFRQRARLESERNHEYEEICERLQMVNDIFCNLPHDIMIDCINDAEEKILNEENLKHIRNKPKNKYKRDGSIILTGMAKSSEMGDSLQHSKEVSKNGSNR